MSPAARAGWAGSVASLTSTAVLALACKASGRTAISGTNAASHWLWGDKAFTAQRVDGRHSLLGYAIHHASAVFWGAVLEAWNRRRPPARPRDTAGRALAVRWQ